jgi:hypothetical protein
MVPKTPQVATACFSCSPPDLNFLVPYFIFMYMHNNHCHQVTAKLQLIKYKVTSTQGMNIHVIKCNH